MDADGIGAGGKVPEGIVTGLCLDLRFCRAGVPTSILIEVEIDNLTLGVRFVRLAAAVGVEVIEECATER